MPKFMLRGIFFFFLSAFFIFFHSCSLNVPPEEPDTETEIRHNLLTTQMYIAHWQSSEFGFYQNIWMQQLAGVRSGSVMEKVDRYQMDYAHTNDIWAFYFEYCLLGLETILNQANTLNAPAFKGIANTLKAYTMLMMTDSWGDMPFTQAHFYFGAGLPAYDRQEDILPTLLELIDLAVAQLEAGNEPGSLIPLAQDDPIFNGNLDRWIRAANLTRIRIMLRLANKTGDYSQVFGTMQSISLLRDNADNMLYHFDGAGTSGTNPYYYYDREVQHTRMGSFMVQLLKETEDPRLPRYVRRNIQNEYLGSAPGQSLSSASYIGLGIASDTSPLMMLTYAEQKFIEAELYLRAGQQANADQAYTQGVKASLQYMQVSDPSWEATHAEITGLTMQQIITAKYTALFLQPEVWTDFRRTGYPALPPHDDKTIPRKFIYPQNEISGNQSNVPDPGTIFDRVWWDNE